MKKFELFFTFLQLPIDFLMIALGGISAFSLRYASFATAIRPVVFSLRWEKYFPLVLATAAAWVGLFALAGLYNTSPNKKLSGEITRVILACSTGFAAITIYVFFTLQKFDSRFLVLAGWIFATVYVCAGRIFLTVIKKISHRLGYGLRKTVIVGRNTVADQIKEAFASKPSLGYSVDINYDHFDDHAKHNLLLAPPDEIIFTNPKGREHEVFSAIDFANEHHITFKYSADLFSTISTNMAVSSVASIPIIELRLTRLSGWNGIIKRIFDVAGSILLIIFTLPLLAVISIIIAFETGFPIIYKNERVGRYDKKFFTLKFRSMYQKDCTGPDCEKGRQALEAERKLIEKQSVKSGPIYKIKDDPRVTPFGRFIRKWSLDELPQFFNVLKGDMSMVGPRPHQPREVGGYEKRHKIVFAIRPGITGLAQISGRSNLAYEEELNLDTLYVENWSLPMDMIILIKTPFIVLFRKGAW